jgi:hypothetical protein
MEERYLSYAELLERILVIETTENIGDIYPFSDRIGYN